MIIEQEEEMFLVVYRQHNQLNLDTVFFGPFTTWAEADDHLTSLPALGIHQPADDLDNPGVKYIAALTSPDFRNDRT